MASCKNRNGLVVTCVLVQGSGLLGIYIFAQNIICNRSIIEVNRGVRRVGFILPKMISVCPSLSLGTNPSLGKPSCTITFELAAFEKHGQLNFDLLFGAGDTNLGK